jgi:pyruvate formate lyase activating enzyme
VLLDIKHIDPKWHERVTGWKDQQNNCHFDSSKRAEKSYAEKLSEDLSAPLHSARDDNDNNKSSCVPSIKFANYLESQGNIFWIRYVLVPGYTDQPEYLEKMASDLSIYQNLERIEILPYHTMGEYKYEELGIEYKLKGIEPPTKEEIEKAKAILEKSGKKVFIR